MRELWARPDAGAARSFREPAGAGKPMRAVMKACYAADADEAAGIAWEKWRVSALPGGSGRVLPAPEHLRPGAAAGEHAGRIRTPISKAIEEHRKAGFDEQLIDVHAREIIPGFVPAQAVSAPAR